MIAGVVGYALVVQLILAAVANGAALTHAADGVWRICSSANGAPFSDGETDPARSQSLCCVVPTAVAAVSPPPPLPWRPVVTLRLAPAVPPPLATAAVVGHAGQARAPPVGSCHPPA